MPKKHLGLSPWPCKLGESRDKILSRVHEREDELQYENCPWIHHFVLTQNRGDRTETKAHFRSVGNIKLHGFTLSLPRVINFKFLLQPHQNYYITQYGELRFIAHSDERWLYSQFLTTSLLHLSLKNGRIYFLSLGVKGFNTVWRVIGIAFDTRCFLRVCSRQAWSAMCFLS